MLNGGQTLSLHGRGCSVVIEQSASMMPVWRHWGARVAVDDVPPLAAMRGAASFSLDDDRPFPVLPVGGDGWFGPAALSCRRGEVGSVVVFDQVTAARDLVSITITAISTAARVTVGQHITLHPDDDVLTIWTEVTNDGATPLSVDQLASGLLPLPARAGRIRSFHGRHNAEFQWADEPMPAHGWRRAGRRGLTGHGGPAGAFVLADAAGWHSGDVFAVQLGWSGDSELAIDRDDEGYWTVSAGVRLAPGEVVLAPGETWRSPDLLATYSADGLNGASSNFHSAIRRRVTWPGGTMRPRPVHFNSWEACYFAHDEPTMMALASRAAALGVERFVLDDGWFKGRDDDRAGLGDWTVDARKYPDGLARLAAHVNGLGMEFGLWVEPEMVNADSDLYRAHPDWALAVAGQTPPTARHQLVLNVARGDVRDHLFAAIDRLLTDLPISYLKWDHNRDLSPATDAVGQPLGQAQVRGAYDLLARIRAAHPSVEIEACAGGGGRIDAGIAVHTHRFWTSDNIDALSRVAIQRGFLAFMPPEMMGCHIGASPAHATGRRQRIDFRAAVAMPGHLGVEMDPAKLTDDETTELADWIGWHRQWRDLLHRGRVWLGDGPDGLVWQAQGDADRFLLFVWQVAPPQARRPQPLPLPMTGDGAWRVQVLRSAAMGGAYGLAPGPMFAEMVRAPQRFPDGWLSAAGLPMPPIRAEGAVIFLVERDT